MHHVGFTELRMHVPDDSVLFPKEERQIFEVKIVLI
jgi:hypothetical protein